jgi:hypothetical protein
LVLFRPIQVSKVTGRKQNASAQKCWHLINSLQASVSRVGGVHNHFLQFSETMNYCAAWQ